MPKPKPKAAVAPAPPTAVRIKALAQFRHDGSYVAPGTLLMVDESEAHDLVSMGFARVIERAPVRR